MQRSPALLFAGLLAAPLMLVSSAALAGPDACFLTDAASCDFVVSTGSCEAMCTPGSFTAQCEGQCTASASVDCTGSCEASCMANCSGQPPMLSCSAACQSNCTPECQTYCTGNSDETACIQSCGEDCNNRCEVSCSATPGMVSCTGSCQSNCNVSCTAQANLSCQANCTAQLTLPDCQANCQLPTGALFCDGQYIDIANATDACINYVDSLDLTASGTCTATGCTGGVGCAVTPASLGASSDRWGFTGIAGLVMGLGLFVSRRRRG